MKFAKTTALLAALLLGASMAMAQQSTEVMGDMGAMGGMGKETAAHQLHRAIGTVKKLDRKNQVVTIAHGAVATLNWPAMTMSFKVKDKALLPKLTEGRKVNVEFTRQGDDYVITQVK